MDKILIDSDVILDFLFDRKPYADDASIVLSMCESGKIQGFVTPVIISNVYYILRRIARHETVVKKLSGLLTIVDVLIIDKAILTRALDSGFSDFEDALQNYAAEKSGNIDLILTRNVKDYKKSRLGILTPENYLGGI